MEEFLHNWGYLGIFLGIIMTGLGMPMPEELPVVIGGALVHDINALYLRWWLMLASCIAGVIVGDSCLYLIGRLWGSRLVELPFIKKHLLTPERMASISENFAKYGVKILLFARLTPGIRAPIFVTAGTTKLPWIKFLMADGIYAIPGVSILFFLGYWFTDTVVALIEATESQVKLISYLVVLGGVTFYFIYRHLRKPVVEGSPKEMPPVVGPVTNRLEQTLEHTLETVKGRILHPSGETKHQPDCAFPPEPADRADRADRAADNGPIDAGNGAQLPHDERSPHNS